MSYAMDMMSIVSYKICMILNLKNTKISKLDQTGGIWDVNFVYNKTISNKFCVCLQIVNEKWKWYQSKIISVK